MRAPAIVLLSATLALPAACSGRGSGAPAPEHCPALAWGGWDGSPQCAGIAATVIAGRDRYCVSDPDCVLVGATNCSANTVNAQSAPRYQTLPAPCTHPLAGMCLPVAWRAACQQGCCVVAR